MKKGFFYLLVLTAILFSTEKVRAQQLKIGVFDIDNMVTAMPGYRNVDSLLQIYQNDSLATEYSIYANEYKRLDSTWKADSAAGKPKAVLDYTGGKRQEMYMNLAYWQQIAQTKYENKRSQLAKPLYEQVYGAYKKVVSQKKYALVLKPGAYEPGNPGDNLFPVDNLFISVAKELKLTSLPQELLYLGGDPDASKTANTVPQKTNPSAPNKKP